MAASAGTTLGPLGTAMRRSMPPGWKPSNKTAAEKERAKARLMARCECKKGGAQCQTVFYGFLMHVTRTGELLCASCAVGVPVAVCHCECPGCMAMCVDSTNVRSPTTTASKLGVVEPQTPTTLQLQSPTTPSELGVVEPQTPTTVQSPTTPSEHDVVGQTPTTVQLQRQPTPEEWVIVV